jgi:hypothetical protein
MEQSYVVFQSPFFSGEAQIISPVVIHTPFGVKVESLNIIVTDHNGMEQPQGHYNVTFYNGGGTNVDLLFSRSGKPSTKKVFQGFDMTNFDLVMQCQKNNAGENTKVIILIPPRNNSNVAPTGGFVVEFVMSDGSTLRSGIFHVLKTKNQQVKRALASYTFNGLFDKLQRGDYETLSDVPIPDSLHKTMKNTTDRMINAISTRTQREQMAGVVYTPRHVRVAENAIFFVAFRTSFTNSSIESINDTVFTTAGCGFSVVPISSLVLDDFPVNHMYNNQSLTSQFFTLQEAGGVGDLNVVFFKITNVDYSKLINGTTATINFSVRSIGGATRRFDSQDFLCLTNDYTAYHEMAVVVKRLLKGETADLQDNLESEIARCINVEPHVEAVEEVEFKFFTEEELEKMVKMIEVDTVYSNSIDKVLDRQDDMLNKTLDELEEDMNVADEVAEGIEMAKKRPLEEVEEDFDRINGFDQQYNHEVKRTRSDGDLDLDLDLDLLLKIEDYSDDE